MIGDVTLHPEGLFPRDRGLTLRMAKPSGSGKNTTIQLDTCLDPAVTAWQVQNQIGLINAIEYCDSAHNVIPLQKSWTMVKIVIAQGCAPIDPLKTLTWSFARNDFGSALRSGPPQDAFGKDIPNQLVITSTATNSPDGTALLVQAFNHAATFSVGPTITLTVANTARSYFP